MHISAFDAQCSGPEDNLPHTDHNTCIHPLTVGCRSVEFTKHGLEDSSGKKKSKKHSKEKGYISVLNWKLTAICASL